MGTTLSSLRPPAGAKHKKKRLGRGTGSGQGKTAGKGHKGQNSRSGGGVRWGFEGGQMPLQQRVPKRGFKNPFRVEYFPVNLSRLDASFSKDDVVDLSSLKEKGIIPRKAVRFKVLGDGELKTPLTIKASKISRSAQDKVVSSGGTVELV